MELNECKRNCEIQIHEENVVDEDKKPSKKRLLYVVNT
jgi:hypothetical protein